VDIRKRSFIRPIRESELPIVPVGFQGQQNLGRGKGQCFHHVLKKGRKEIAVEAGNSEQNSGTSEETIPEGQAGTQAVKATGRR
jgi:hypothetical protein